jgi:RNA-directed DNA polymerase
VTSLASLKSANKLGDVATLLGYAPSSLAFVVYKLPLATKYHEFSITKRNGGMRTISAPAPELKLVQRRLADLLQNCVEEINESSGRPDQIAHGFKRERSIITNAKNHRNRRFVFNVDLVDFFGTINFGRVRGFFIKDKNFSLNEKVATLLAQIACHKNALPQGSPCSPVISNLIGHVLDVHLVQLASRTGCTYTRYADDLTFSTSKPEFPQNIARSDTPHIWIAGNELERLVKKSGFAINPAKRTLGVRLDFQIQ